MIQFTDPIWLISQLFALIALILTAISFQCKDKPLVLKLHGFSMLALGISAAMLTNWTLAMLFWLESIRNFTFSYVTNIKLRRVFAGIFIVLVIVSTITVLYIMQAPYGNIYVEWAIAMTQICITIGKVLSGQNFFRISFTINRSFNCFNHIYFGNILGLGVALAGISSNILYYCRLWINRKNVIKK